MAEKTLFTRLQRLFSTDVIIRNIGGDDLRTVDINKIQTTGTIQTNSLIDRFQKIYTGGPSSIYAQNQAQNYQTKDTGIDTNTSVTVLSNTPISGESTVTLLNQQSNQLYFGSPKNFVRVEGDTFRIEKHSIESTLSA